MAYPYTEKGYNMYDMISMLQKAIRRGKFDEAGFAAEQLKKEYRKVMWNRLLVISSEDCFGVLTKEVIALKKKDDTFPLSQNLANCIALMCKSKKSRDACYFACNFVLATRKPREITPSQEVIEELYDRTMKQEGESDIVYDECGFTQLSFDFDDGKSDIPEKDIDMVTSGAVLQEALKHLDIDMIGYEIDFLRYRYRTFLWEVFIDYAENFANIDARREIRALKEADDIVNQKKKDKDEIFISKAAILLCYCNDPMFDDLQACELIKAEDCIDWSKIKVKPIEECRLTGEIPEWVYDCHTLKGKKMGKTDWDMTTTEQDALNPLQPAYFEDASWSYIYEQDYREGTITYEEMIPIREYAKTHPANPVQHLPYK